MTSTPWLRQVRSAIAFVALAVALAVAVPASAEVRLLHEAGNVEAVHTVAVSSPPVWGDSRVVRLVAEGTIVAPGDTLVVLTNERFADLLREVTADHAVQQRVLGSVEAERASHLLASRNAITKARLAMESAALDEENQRFAADLARRQAALGRQQAAISLERAVQDSVAQAGLDSLALARAAIRGQRLHARMKTYQAYLDQLVLTAPAAGMVVYRRERTEEGVSVLRLGDTVGWNQHLLDITDVATLQVQMQVHERDRGRIRPGQRVTAAPDAYPGRTYPGRVTSVQRLPLAAESGAVARTFLVSALLDHVDRDLRPGMSVRATIDLEDPDAQP
ncbi:MAG: efflux RND transporter periplasmic adaptor subunit [Candidatus Krumholzibacteriia bacterium]